jgi:hypothetical protein
MPSTRATEPPEQPHRRHRILAAIGLTPGGRIDEEELSSAILGTVVGLSTMVAAGAHGTLGQVELTVLVTVAIYGPDCYARLPAARSAGRRTKVGSVLRREWPMVEAAYTPTRGAPGHCPRHGEPPCRDLRRARRRDHGARRIGVLRHTPRGRQPVGRGEVVAGERKPRHRGDLAQAGPPLSGQRGTAMPRRWPEDGRLALPKPVASIRCSDQASTSAATA